MDIKNTRPEPSVRLGNRLVKLLVALDGQEAVAWVFIDNETLWQIASLWALILAEVVNSLNLTAAERNLL